MPQFKFSSATDPETTRHNRRFTLRHFFVLIAICSVVALGYTWIKRASRPTEFLAAAQSGDIDSLEQLVRSGVDVHYRDGWRTTALMLASSHGHTECVRFLVENGADPNERARFNATPLIWAAESGKMETVIFLIENGANSSLTDNDGMSAVDHATQNGHIEIANLIRNQQRGITKR